LGAHFAKIESGSKFVCGIKYQIKSEILPLNIQSFSSIVGLLPGMEKIPTHKKKE
jgi:hypothetical protein